MTPRKSTSGAVTVADYAERYASAKWVADDFRIDLINAVRDAYNHGESEVSLARAAGVTRQTIRAWLDK